MSSAADPPALADLLTRYAAGAATGQSDSFVSALCAALGVPMLTRATESGLLLYQSAALLLLLHPAPAARGTPLWHLAMGEGYALAQAHVRTAPKPPPFVLIADVGYCFDLYACFDGTPHYRAFPEPHQSRFLWSELGQNADTLRTVFTEPLRLCPVRRAAALTRAVARPLAALGKRLLKQGHPAESVAGFLLRWAFAMFCEHLGLLPEVGESAAPFTTALEQRWLAAPKEFVPGLESLWRALLTAPDGLAAKLLRGSGSLFAEGMVLPLDRRGLQLLLLSARCDWSQVEPAILGTLLERGLDLRQRHARGGHYTPRAYIERLVRPTLEEPLRADWQAVLATARAEVAGPAPAPALAAAIASVRGFYQQLGRLRILDPACGSGNFLYVTLDLLLRLAGEVLAMLAALSPPAARQAQAEDGVTPGQFLGLELEPRAQQVAELVLWLGYAQRHVRIYGRSLPVPARVLLRRPTLECRDALLFYDAKECVYDDLGQPVSRWDGQTYRTDTVTLATVPAESARAARYRYRNPRRADWPAADFVVGNPPFIGNRRMRTALGDGYVEALRAVYPEVPPSVDYVMYWWHRAAELVRHHQLRRFGLITTKAVAQKYGRQVLRLHLYGSPALSLAFAIANHPWHWPLALVDGKRGADVRIAMTVAQAGRSPGTLWLLQRETAAAPGYAEVELRPTRGLIHPDLTVGADLTAVRPLRANRRLGSPGVKLHGSGFIVSAAQAAALGLGTVAGIERQLRPYRNGRDLLGHSRQAFAIDLNGIAEPELQLRFPALYSWIHERVRSERLAKSQGGSGESAEYAKSWWRFGRPRNRLQKALAALPRYIATVETARHRIFVFLEQQILADNMLICIASADALVLATLSSRIHQIWALASGGRLGVGNDPRYNKTRCFDPFPFPSCGPEQRQRLRELGEALDSHRQQQLLRHPGLTLTGMYNVLEKLRRGEALSAQEQVIKEHGQVAALQTLHDALDAEVGAAYGFPPTLSTAEILARLVGLNAERAQEESTGLCRFLRPEFQSSATRWPSS